MRPPISVASVPWGSRTLPIASRLDALGGDELECVPCFQPNDPLVVVHDFDLKGAGFGPQKTNAILIVDTDAVLIFSISYQEFEAIAGWNL